MLADDAGGIVDVDQARQALDPAAALCIRFAKNYGAVTRAAFLDAAALAFDAWVECLNEASYAGRSVP